MKHVSRTPFCVGVYFSVFLLLSGSLHSKEYFGAITLPLGQVLVQSQPTDDWNRAKFKDSVYLQEQVKTLDKSRCEITLETQAVFRIGEKTVVQLKPSLNRQEKINLNHGRVWINWIADPSQKPLYVRTPTAVCGIRGTVFRLTCDSIYSQYRVYEGVIAVTPINTSNQELEDTTFIVGTGEELLLINDFESYKQIQDESINRFQEIEENEFDTFMQDQINQIQESRLRDEDQYQQFMEHHFLSNRFDQQKDSQYDWVRWNIERDKLVDR